MASLFPECSLNTFDIFTVGHSFEDVTSSTAVTKDCFSHFASNPASMAPNTSTKLDLLSSRQGLHNIVHTFSATLLPWNSSFKFPHMFSYSANKAALTLALFASSFLCTSFDDGPFIPEFDYQLGAATFVSSPSYLFL